MIICTLAGLSGRIFAVNPSGAENCVRPVETCCQHPHEAPAQETHHHDDGGECPLEHHHHHGGCSQPLPPLAVDSVMIYRLSATESSLLGARHEGEALPEGPCLGLEKPPLI